jgi:surfeit locus 1 family protein
MTSERPRFPVGLTLAAVIAFAICCGLGVWQVQRADWKAGQLKRIAALRAAAPVPIVPVLARAAHGESVSQTRVAATCLAAPPAAAMTRETTDSGQWATRAMSFCRLSGAAYDGVWVDRGVVTASRGSTTTAQLTLPAPQGVVGVLSHLKGDCFGSDGCDDWFANLRNPAPYVLVAESETPSAPGVTPAPYAANNADSLQYVGEYAPTWFGLAGVLACVYAAMLWRRHHPKKR